MTENLFADFDVISKYSRADAIEDGTLVDLTKLYPELCRQLYRYPVSVTAAVYSVIESAVSSERHCNDFEGLIWDMLWMSQRGIIKRIDESQHLFQVIINGEGLDRLQTFKIVCHAGDNAEPVLTIMMPDED